MTGRQTLALMARRRVELAWVIIRDPSGVKVCESCDSFHGHETGVCGFCGAYRFDSDPDRVRRNAFLAGQRAHGLSLAVLPRTAAEFDAA